MTYCNKLCIHGNMYNILQQSPSVAKKKQGIATQGRTLAPRLCPIPNPTLVLTSTRTAAEPEPPQPRLDAAKAAMARRNLTWRVRCSPEKGDLDGIVGAEEELGAGQAQVTQHDASKKSLK